MKFEQHSPFGLMLFHLGNAINFLHVTLTTHCHTHYYFHPFKDLVAKQHPTRTCNLLDWIDGVNWINVNIVG